MLVRSIQGRYPAEEYIRTTKQEGLLGLFRAMPSQISLLLHSVSCKIAYFAFSSPRRWVASIGIFLCLAADVHSGDGASLSKATDLLVKVESTYTNCRSYRDTGTVEIEYSDFKDWTSRCHFKTFFVRPDRFSFTFFAPEDEYRIRIVKSKDFSCFQRTHLAEQTKQESLDAMVSRAAGVTKRTSGIIIGLLLPEISSSKFFRRLQHLGIEKTTRLEEKDYFALNGMIEDQDVEVLIACDSLLIHRITVRSEVSGYSVRRTYRFKPELDTKIDETKFRASKAY